jgi:hypothetical protein
MAPAGAPSTASLDVAALRRSWPSLLARLQERRQMILHATLEVVTPASFDGETLELAFPPDRGFGVERVEAKSEELRSTLKDVFGIQPRIRCVVREAAVASGSEVEEDPPVSEDEALALIKAELDAEVGEPTTSSS